LLHSHGTDDNDHKVLFCVSEKIITCPEDTDSRGTTWPVTLQDQLNVFDCADEDFTGNWS